MPHLLAFAPRNPYPAEEIRARFGGRARVFEAHAPLPANWQATTIGVLYSACADSARGHSVLAYLTGKTSSKDLTDGEWWSLYAWVFPHHVDDCPLWCSRYADVWHVHPALSQEIENILTARLEEIGQTRFPFLEDAPVKENYVPDPRWDFHLLQPDNGE